MPPLFIEEPVTSQAIEPSCICVLRKRLFHFLRFFYRILEMFRQCGIFFFAFDESAQYRCSNCVNMIHCNKSIK